MPTLKLVTLGCKVNQYESEYVREALGGVGFRAPEPGEPVDWCIVNTCTVTAQSDHKSRKLIRHLAKEHPTAQLVVMGCYATRAPAEAASLPGVVEVLTDKRRLPEFLARFGLVEPPRTIRRFGRRHRAYVKVQDGCRMACSYCIIPKVRPVLESRPLADVLDEVRGLVARGYREIVLTGIHLGHYGLCSSSNLTDLVEALARLDGDFRLRISSIEAAEATDRLLGVMAEHGRRICPHLHLSMQSGADDVLRRMRRPTSHAEFAKRCRAATERLDRPALTTDVIVGFPGESDADFEATCRAVRAIGFAKVHVFPFSPREGTEAATLPDPVPRRVVHERVAHLIGVAVDAREAFLRSLVGRTVQVLVEGSDADRPGTLLGTSARYAPVALSGGPEQIGQLVDATVHNLVAGQLQASSLPPSKGQTSPISRITGA